MSRILLSGSRPWALSASCCGLIALLAMASHLGCEPAEMGSIDMAKAKSVAAENGIEAKRAGGSMGGSKAKGRMSRTEATKGAKGLSGLPQR